MFKRIKQIKYTKDNGDVSYRSIIPMANPSHLLRALDISDYTDDEKEILLDTLNEIDNIQTELLNNFDLKWRSFKPANIEELNTDE